MGILVSDFPILLHDHFDSRVICIVVSILTLADKEKVIAHFQDDYNLFQREDILRNDVRLGAAVMAIMVRKVSRTMHERLELSRHGNEAFGFSVVHLPSMAIAKADKTV